MAKKRLVSSVPKARTVAGNGGAAGRKRIPLMLWLGIAGALLLVAGLAVLLRPQSGAARAAQAPQFTGGAKLVVGQQKVDFGTVPLGKAVKATFKLTNVGDKPLELAGAPTIEVKAGC